MVKRFSKRQFYIKVLESLITYYYSQFHYDGHHYSLVFDHSLDFINGSGSWTIKNTTSNKDINFNVKIGTSDTEIMKIYARKLRARSN